MSCFTALVVRSKAFSLSCTTSAPGKGNVYMKRVRWSTVLCREYIFDRWVMEGWGQKVDKGNLAYYYKWIRFWEYSLMEWLLRAEKESLNGTWFDHFFPLPSLVSMDTDCSTSCLALSNPLNALKARFSDVAFRQWHNTQISSPPSPSPNLFFLPLQSSHSWRPPRHGPHPGLRLLLA